MRVSVLVFVALVAAPAVDPSPEATSVLDREGAAVSGGGSGDKMVDRE